MTHKTLFDEDITFEEAEELIKNGADVNEPDAFGQTPLYYTNYSKIVQLYIENGANVNHVDNNGWTPLFYVSDYDVFQLLIARGADVNAVNEHGETPLYCVENIDMIKLLIKHGVDVNHKNKYGRTPISFIEYTEMLQLLIDHGAELNIRDNYGMTPVDRQIGKYNGTFSDFLDNAKLLIANGAIAGKIVTYQKFREYFTPEQQRVFDSFLLLTSDDYQFFQMCFTYQESIKNNEKMNVKDMDIV